MACCNVIKLCRFYTYQSIFYWVFAARDDILNDWGLTEFFK